MNDSEPTLKTLEQTRKDDAIALETAGLNLWGDDPAEILAKALIEYFGPDSVHACTVAQCAILLRNSFPLYQQLVKAHQTRSYRALVDAVKTAQLVPGSPGVLPESPPEPSVSIPPTSTPASTTTPPKAVELLRRIVPSLQKILRSDWKWNSWRPESLSASDNSEIHSWLSDLEIPLLNNEPSLLLHRLGNLQDDPDMDERLSKIFNPAFVTFLVNTAGSGKTRQILEGICRHWGFYFCSTTQSDKFGSDDMMNCIAHRLVATEGFTSILPQTEYSDMLAKNRAIASDCINQVLLARLLVFRAFIDCIVDSGRPITEEDKCRWVYVQVAPALLSPASTDVFDELAQILNAHGTSAAICQETLNLLFHQLRNLINQNSEAATKPTFYFVLDEAQYAANHLSSAFRSEQYPTKSRSVLREMIVALRDLLMPDIGVEVAGTGIDEKLVEETLTSIIFKTTQYKWWSLTGSFDRYSDLHEAYIRRYIPPTILDTAIGKRLLKRITEWLEGRFRFTATFLANLLKSDFLNPHQFLDDWITYQTKFRPTDATDLTSPCPVTTTFTTAPLYKQIDFGRFYTIKGFSSLLTTALYESLLRDEIASTITGTDHSLVEAGFARYRSSDCTSPRISEPLVLLTATRYLDEDERGPSNNLWQHVIRHIGSNTGSKHNGFENYLAFLLAHAFGKPTPLKDVFDFPKLSVPAWAEQSARLVVLSRDTESEELSAYEFDWPSFAVPSGQFGRSFDKLGTLEWLKQQHQTAFCFPDNTMGPDIVFVLQLENGKFIWVSLQAKYLGSSISDTELRKAIRSTVPDKYWIQKNGLQTAHVKHPTLAADTHTALKALPGPNGTKTDYPVLRVVVVSPPDVGIDQLDETTDKTAISTPENHHDPGKHPLCALNWEHLINSSQVHHIVDGLRTFVRSERRRQAVAPIPSDTTPDSANSKRRRTPSRDDGTETGSVQLAKKRRPRSPVQSPVAGPSGLSRNEKNRFATRNARYDSPFGGSTNSYASPPPASPAPESRWSSVTRTPPPQARPTHDEWWYTP